MKKILSLFMFLITAIVVFGIMWFFYPQYEIYKIKKEIEIASTEDSKNKAINSDSEKQLAKNYIEYLSESKKSMITNVGLGDSIIQGYGVGAGYDFVSLTATKLKTEINKEVQVKNFGESGLTSIELLNYIESGKYSADLQEAHIITINIGGNDVLKIAKSKNFYEAFKSFEDIRANFETNLDSILTEVERVNPNAIIVLPEMYNPLPYDSEFYEGAQKLLPKWNVTLYKTAMKYNAIVVNVTDVINSKNREFISEDGVHPNAEGHDAIANQVVNSLETTLKKE